MIGKSFDQSMTIDALLVNWHWLASVNRWSIDNHTKVVATHRLPSIGVKKSQCPTRSSLYVYALAAVTVRTNVWDLNSFTELFVCMQLYGFKNQQQKHTLKQCFEETSKKHTFSLSCSSLSYILLMSGWYEFLGILYFHYFLFSNRSCAQALQDEIIIIWFIDVKFLRIIKCSVTC